MSLAPFKFTEVRLNPPHDNLCAAIGLIQAEILAEDSGLDPEVMFGSFHFRRAPLETAVAMLVAMVGEAESLRWHSES
ncbi:hypothetical protein [Paracoccus thiocyanatus]|uniref:Uncharacterized protein n=1 Tax=Paracoccus thiocyanatus TaxID=34006 RepID=A0A3D8PAH5_9RHOB|nr:hypothetical protein [Paracoccus thiocyanatus]RDW12632.1 hypothetical protein DIE28_12515 [Paracoccus thiocyanatus]